MDQSQEQPDPALIWQFLMSFLETHQHIMKKNPSIQTS
jgi:hypothetical protein